MIEAWLQKVLNRIGTPAGADLASDIAAQSAILEGFQPNQRLIAEYEADGDIAQGDFVGITSEGKATKINTFVQTPFTSTLTEIHSGIYSGGYTVPVLLPGQNKVAILYPSGTDLYLVLGTLGSDGTPTWTSPQDTTLDLGTSTNGYAMCAAGADRLAITYGGTDDDAYLVMISLNGTSIQTVGAPSEIVNDVPCTATAVCYPYTDIVLCAQFDANKLVAASVSGTIVSSFGTSVNIGYSGVATNRYSMNTPNSSDGLSLISYYSSGAYIGGVKVDTTTLDLTYSARIENSYNTYPNESLMFLNNDTAAIVAQHSDILRITVVNYTSLPSVGLQSVYDFDIKALLNLGEYDQPYSIIGTSAGKNRILVFVIASSSPSSNIGAFLLSYNGASLEILRCHATTSNVPYNPMGRLVSEDGIILHSSRSSNYPGIFAGFGCVADNVFDVTAHQATPIDGLLGIAEDNITDGNTGTICTMGTPLNQTKTGMSADIGWYSTGLSRIPLLQKKRDGSTGLWACPLSTEDVQIRPEAAGETSWMLE